MSTLLQRPALLLLAAFPAALAPAHPAQETHEQEIGERETDELVAAERGEADLLRRRGRVRDARRLLTELLTDDPSDPASRRLLALCRLDEARYERALEEATLALADARERGGPQRERRALIAACARTLSRVLSTLGRYEEALAVLRAGPGPGTGSGSGNGSGPGGERILDPAGDARDAYALGLALEQTGDREAATRLYAQGLEVARDAPWEQHYADGLCAWRLGRLREASLAIVAADAAARAGEGVEPDLLAALAGIYFESEREVEEPGKRSAGNLYREALEIHPTHEGALVGLFELHRYNRLRVSRSPEEILEELLTARPASIEGLLAKLSADLSDGRLKSARRTITTLEGLAPARAELVSLKAALAWVEHRRDDCQALLAELTRRAPRDARPERTVGRHLIELYRFAEALPFLERAVQRDPADWDSWTYLGRALANVGREDEAREALARAVEVARGRQDAWRNNTVLVLRRMRDEHVLEEFGELGFSWRPDASAVLRAYLVPYYEQAREELAARYGYTPGATTIEVFRRHQDFSVRSVGFEGFPALGVCFGPVVTALSPLSEMRGNFSWARTGFHEFSHVVHLGLSHNRCPRWITEGLATWEEVNRNASWTRNMRRELVDALANDDLIPVRELNRAFRGPRILFGYYQGGLLCEMLVEDHGFPPMVRILGAFDRGLDLDRALSEVFATTPEELDRRFEDWVRELVAPLSIEPRWSASRVTRLRLSLRRDPPQEPPLREAWAEGWTTVAWGSWQRGQRLDAEEALRQVARSGLEPLRALTLRGELALDGGDERAAEELWQRALKLGGRDYRALVALAGLLQARSELEQAERVLLLAEQAFPGYDRLEFNAELRLAQLYHVQGRDDDELGALERWLAWNPGEYANRLRVARWHADAGRQERAVELYAEANEVDPFRRDLHREWGDALEKLERWDEALREYTVAMDVPADLDADHLRAPGHGGDGPLTLEQELELLTGVIESGGARFLRLLGVSPEHVPDDLDPEDLDPEELARFLLGITEDPPEGLDREQADLLRGVFRSQWPGMRRAAPGGVPLSSTERADLLRRRARCLRALERPGEAEVLETQAASIEGAGSRDDGPGDGPGDGEDDGE